MHTLFSLSYFRPAIIVEHWCLWKTKQFLKTEIMLEIRVHQGDASAFYLVSTKFTKKEEKKGQEATSHTGAVGNLSGGWTTPQKSFSASQTQ